MAILPPGTDTRLGRRFVKTYAGAEDGADEWERLQSFVRVREAVAEEKSPSEVVDLPWRKIQGWVKGGEPKSLKGLRTAASHGWLQPTGETRRGLVGLLAWSLSNGLIREYDRQWEVRLYTDVPDAETRLGELFESVGVGWVTRDVEGETPMAKPAQDGAVLARLLLAMGATVTGKGDSQTDHLPWFLDTVADYDRTFFAQVWVTNIGVDLPINDGVSLLERRPDSFRAELVGLLDSVTTGAVTGEEGLIHLDKDAAAELFEPRGEQSRKKQSQVDDLTK